MKKGCDYDKQLKRMKSGEQIGFKTLYKCDPDMNPNCKKTSCYKYVPEGFTERCSLTIDQECAMLDEKGEPIVAFMIPTKDKDGGEKYEKDKVDIR